MVTQNKQVDEREANVLGEDQLVQMLTGAAQGLGEVIQAQSMGSPEGLNVNISGQDIDFSARNPEKTENQLIKAEEAFEKNVSPDMKHIKDVTDFKLKKLEEIDQNADFLGDNWGSLLTMLAGTAMQMVAAHNNNPGLMLGGGAIKDLAGAKIKGWNQQLLAKKKAVLEEGRGREGTGDWYEKFKAEATTRAETREVRREAREGVDSLLMRYASSKGRALKQQEVIDVINNSEWADEFSESEKQSIARFAETYAPKPEEAAIKKQLEKQEVTEKTSLQNKIKELIPDLKTELEKETTDEGKLGVIQNALNNVGISNDVIVKAGGLKQFLPLFSTKVPSTPEEIKQLPDSSTDLNVYTKETKMITDLMEIPFNEEDLNEEVLTTDEEKKAYPILFNIPEKTTRIRAINQLMSSIKTSAKAKEDKDGLYRIKAPIGKGYTVQRGVRGYLQEYQFGKEISLFDKTWDHEPSKMEIEYLFDKSEFTPEAKAAIQELRDFLSE